MLRWVVIGFLGFCLPLACGGRGQETDSAPTSEARCIGPALLLQDSVGGEWEWSETCASQAHCDSDNARCAPEPCVLGATRCAPFELPPCRIEPCDSGAPPILYRVEECVEFPGFERSWELTGEDC